MEIKILSKYLNSRLNGTLIRQLNVYESGEVVIVSENNDTKTFYLDPENFYHSADYLLCMVQDDEGVTVSKY